MEELIKLKKEGNQFFQQNDYESAISLYKQVIKGFHAFIEANGIQEEQDMLRAIYDIELPCYLNQSICYLKLKQYQKSKKKAQKVLDIDPYSVKALYRKGMANLLLLEFDAAEKDLNMALTYDKNNSDIASTLEKLYQQKKEYMHKQKKTMQKIIETPSLIENPQTQKVENTNGIYTKDQYEQNIHESQQKQSDNSIFTLVMYCFSLWKELIAWYFRTILSICLSILHWMLSLMFTPKKKEL